MSLHSDEAIGELLVAKEPRKYRHHVHLVIVPSQAVLRVIDMILKKDKELEMWLSSLELI